MPRGRAYTNPRPLILELGGRRYEAVLERPEPNAEESGTAATGQDPANQQQGQEDGGRQAEVQP